MKHAVTCTGEQVRLLEQSDIDESSGKEKTLKSKMSFWFESLYVAWFALRGRPIAYKVNVCKEGLIVGGGGLVRYVNCYNEMTVGCTHHEKKGKI